MDDSKHLVVFISFPTVAEAKSVAQTLVSEKLAACVHVLSGITAIYRWKGKIEEEPQTLLVVKTTQTAWSALLRRVKTLHSDEVPEIIALPVVEGLPAYLDWIDSVVRCNALAKCVAPKPPVPPASPP